MIPFVDLKIQYEQLKPELWSTIERIFENSAFILGDDLEKLEKSFAKFSGAKYGVGVASGTSALETSLRAYNIGLGDEVITVANTYIATALAISWVGAKPVLVDVDPVYYTMDVEKFKEAITPKTRAVIPVHLYGQSADMSSINRVALEHNLMVLEDACQAHGAEYKGMRVGSLGDIAAFSYYPSKNLGSYGDGGMVVTDNKRAAEYIKMLRNYGEIEKYNHIILGHNHCLDNLQAAMLLIKLKHLDYWNEQRRRNAALYDSAFKLWDLPVVTPAVADYSKHVYHLYVVLADRRDELRAYLNDLRIQTGIHYPIPVHLQTAYTSLGYKRGDFPVTENLSKRILSLPMFPELTEDQIYCVVEAIKNFYELE